MDVAVTEEEEGADDNAKNPDEDEVDETTLIQKVAPQYADVLNDLLSMLSAMPPNQAGRIAEHLRQHLIDLRRPSPHP